MARVALPYGLGADTMDKQASALLCLLAEEPQLLREPVAPLSAFLPRAPGPPRAAFPGYGDGWSPSVHLTLPPELHERLARAAEDGDLPLSEWLTSELSRLASWPVDERWGPWGRARFDGGYPYDGYPYDGYPYDDEPPDDRDVPDDGWATAAAR